MVTEIELVHFSKNPSFNRFFVFKEFHEGLVHYFKSKYLSLASWKATDLFAVEQPIISQSLGPLQKSRALEERLASFVFSDPGGMEYYHKNNQKVFEVALRLLLVDKAAMKSLV